MANLKLYDPFEFSDEMGRLFWGLKRHKNDQESRVSFVPSIDVAESPETLSISVELPGMKKDDVKITVREGILTISGEKKFKEEEKKENYYRIERSYGSFVRSFNLPNTVDSEAIRAQFENGVLELAIPKKPEAKERTIDVEVK
ncbi:MAG: Hsp20/alpha crystallin family protein [Deltaproteobacteria bacterium]|nr:Hsp20/alpha crystallin family protein [Deltaproteobacteria bacterium]